jgi:hypothetical protein
LQPYYSQLLETVDRTRTLISAARLLSPGVADDVLRSAVVLTHALLEDFLRTLTRRLLPKADMPALKEIPLAGLDGRKFQFHLGHLVKHRGKSVDEVIQQSVDEFLERSTFNNTTEIARWLAMLGLNVPGIESRFPVLDQMIRRRHQIVHRADRVRCPSLGSHSLEPIHLERVGDWLEATYGFAAAIVSSIAARSVVRALRADSVPSEDPAPAAAPRPDGRA